MSAKMTPEERRARIREIEHRNHALGRHWVRVETCEDCRAALAAPSTPEPSGLVAALRALPRYVTPDGEETYLEWAAVRDLIGDDDGPR